MKRACIILAVIVLIASILVAIPSNVGNVEGSAGRRNGVQFTLVPAFRIESSGDFAAHASSGDGSMGNPWIIEFIEVNGSGLGYCIYVGNTSTTSFIIRNSYLHNASGNGANYFWNSGIVLYNVAFGTLFNNTLSGNDDGIHVESSGNVAITNNTATSNLDDGIFIKYCSSSVPLTGNNASGNSYGIYLQQCSGNNVNGNTANSNSMRGIMLYQSHGNTVNGNTACSNGYFGIQIDNSNNTNCDNNNASFNGAEGIDLWAANNTELSGNTISGNGMGINSVLSTYNNIQTNTFTNDGIYIYGSLSHWNTHTITGSNTVNGKAVYYWNGVTNNIVPAGAGEVILVGCSNVTVDGQNVSNGDVGIEIGFSNNITVTNNTVLSNSNEGIYVCSSNNNTFMNNTASSNVKSGILLSGSGNNLLSNNTLSSNSQSGINILSSSSNLNTIRNNTISNNQVGISDSGAASNNKIYHNDFINNTEQAEDYATNQWDNGYPSGGNYWRDYNGTDLKYGPGQNITGADGIGDTPWNISGSAGAKDNFPLMTPADANDILAPNSTATPAVMYWNNASQVNVTATAHDTRSNVSSVELWYSFNGGAYSLLNSDNATPWVWNFTWPSGEGNYSFYTRANDLAGNYEAAHSTADSAAGYDGTAPTSSIGPITKYWQTGSSVPLTASASDSTSGVQNVTLWYRQSADNSTWSSWKQFNTTSSLYSYNFTFPDGEGYYEVYSTVNDTANNTEAAPSTPDTRFAYDSTTPTITDGSGSAGTTGDTFVIRSTVTDNLNLSAVNIVYWFGTGAATNSTANHSSANGYELNVSLPSNSLDVVYYRIEASDRAGNWLSTSVKNVTISDNDLPAAEAGADQTAQLGVSIAFNGAASTDNIGVANYTWTFNDGAQNVVLYGATASHAFTVAGNFSIVLTVKDAAGNSATDSLTVTVAQSSGSPSGDSGLGNYLWIIVVIVIIAVVAVVAVIFLRKGKVPKAAPPQEPPQ